MKTNFEKALDNNEKKLKKGLEDLRNLAEEQKTKIRENPFITHKLTWWDRLLGIYETQEDVYIRRVEMNLRVNEFDLIKANLIRNELLLRAKKAEEKHYAKR